MTTAARDDRWNRLSLTILAAGVAALLAAGILFVLAFTGVVGKEGNSLPTTVTAFRVDITPAPTPTVEVPPSEAPITRLAIPRFDVDAPVVIRGVDENRIMETPDGPLDVAWYDFSQHPGFGSNAIFSGHVDWYNYGPAVFWNLQNLEPGDLIEVHLEDGTVYRYSVFDLYQVSAAPSEDELREIVDPTDVEVVTLITCGGSFDSAIGEYDSRTIVRAERVYESAPPAAESP